MSRMQTIADWALRRPQQRGRPRGYIVLQWVMRLVMFFVVAHRQRAQKAWAWIAIIFLSPVFGSLAYLFLGDRALSRKREVRYRRIRDRLDEAGKLRQIDHHRDPLLIGDGPIRDISTLIERNGGMPAIGGNEAELLSQPGDDSAGGEILSQLLEDIDSAQRNIHAIFYIFREDDVGHRVARALVAAAERGVRVRLLADEFGSRPLFRSLGRWMAQRGIELHPAMPISPMQGHLRIDMRNHRKIVVIDSQVGHMGSWNVADPDYGRPFGNFRELMVRVRGHVVEHLLLAFYEDWTFATGQDPDPALFESTGHSAGTQVMQLLPSGPNYPHAPLRDLVISSLYAARKRVIITSPYVTPHSEMALALRLAVDRGVRVDMIIPERTDTILAQGAARSLWPTLDQMGVRVHLHRFGVLHSKTLSVDGLFGVVGSANFDKRSFRLNAELAMLLYDGNMVDELVRTQERYIEESRPLSEHDLRFQWAYQVGTDMAKLVSPLV